ncbi:hypothetical protein B7494_g1607 [Chlorociboria aeruginascens]|nr:hypothetical protein B7494_g1607 [Chlorociboria aeruginascens]
MAATEFIAAATLKRVLVIGGSYGGLAAALNLLDLCKARPTRFDSTPFVSTRESAITRAKFNIQIKIVDERDGFYHLIGSPLALASAEYSPKAWIKFADIPALREQGISCVQGSVTQVDFERRTAVIESSGAGVGIEENYDYLVASSGLRRVWPIVPQSRTRENYLLETSGHIQEVKNARGGVVIIGGGAVGIEMAAEVKMVHPDQKVTLIHSRGKLLSSEPLSDEFKDKSLSLLRESGVEVILGHRVTDTSLIEEKNGSPTYKVTLSDGTQLLAGQVTSAISRSIPSTTYLPGQALDPEGYIKVDPRLNLAAGAPNAEYHFAVGDIALWSGIKRCGAAMAMGHNAAINIHQRMVEKMTGKEPNFVEFPEVPPMIALAIGKQAVLYGPEGDTTSGEDAMEMMFGNDLGLKSMMPFLKPLLRELTPDILMADDAVAMSPSHGIKKMDEKKGKSKDYRGFVAGVFSGIAKLSVGHPFDTIKVRMQTSDKSKFSGPLQCLLQTVRKEGFSGLYKGATPPLVGWMFMDSIMLGSLTFYRRILHQTLFNPNHRTFANPSSFARRDLPLQDEQLHKLPTLGHAMAGVMAGATVSFVAAPVEHIKARLQIQYSNNKSERLYKGPIDCARKIYRYHGISGIYHGLSATLLFRSFFFFWWGSYDVFTRLLSEKTKLSTPAINFWAGGLSAQVFWITSYPSDVVKQRIMTDPLAGGLNDGVKKFSNWTTAAKAVYVENGAKGYWRGFLPCFLRAFPANAMALVAFESVMRALP